MSYLSVCHSYVRQETFEWQAPKREDFKVKNIEWLTIDQFTPEKAEGKINEFIKVNFYFFCV